MLNFGGLPFRPDVFANDGGSPCGVGGLKPPLLLDPIPPPLLPDIPPRRPDIAPRRPDIIFADCGGSPLGVGGLKPTRPLSIDLPVLILLPFGGGPEGVGGLKPTLPLMPPPPPLLALNLFCCAGGFPCGVGGLKPVRPLPMGIPLRPLPMGIPLRPLPMGIPLRPLPMGIPLRPLPIGIPLRPLPMGIPLRPLPMGIPLRPLPIPPLLALLCTIWPLLWLGVGGFAKPVFAPVALLRELIPPLRPETMGPPRRLEPIPPRRPLLTPMLGFKVGGARPDNLADIAKLGALPRLAVAPRRAVPLPLPLRALGPANLPVRCVNILTAPLPAFSQFKNLSTRQNGCVNNWPADVCASQHRIKSFAWSDKDFAEHNSSTNLPTLFKSASRLSLSVANDPL